MFKRIAISNIGIVNSDDDKEFLTLNNKGVISFKYDPENFVYFRCRAITADVPNKNGDYFPEEEIIKSYKTFINVGVYKDHDADSVNKAVGKILWADYIPEGKYVELIGCIDKKLDPDLARRVQMGIIDSCSMGCVVKEAECSICHNIAKNPSQLCKHMHPTYGIKGSIDSNGNIVYEINRGIQFTELSLVTVPADSTAKLFEVVAMKKSDNRFSILNYSIFKDINNYNNDFLNRLYETIRIGLDNENLMIKTVAKGFKSFFDSLDLFNKQITNKFKDYLANLLVLSDPRLVEVINFYKANIKRKQKRILAKEYEEAMEYINNLLKSFPNILKILSNNAKDPDFKFALMYCISNGITMPILSKIKEFIKQENLSEDYFDFFELYNKLFVFLSRNNYPNFSFPIHEIGEPFDYLAIDKLNFDTFNINLTELERLLLQVIPENKSNFVNKDKDKIIFLSLIRNTSYYNALRLYYQAGDNFLNDYEKIFGVNIKDNFLKYIESYKKGKDLKSKHEHLLNDLRDKLDEIFGFEDIYKKMYEGKAIPTERRMKGETLKQHIRYLINFLKSFDKKIDSTLFGRYYLLNKYNKQSTEDLKFGKYLLRNFIYGFINPEELSHLNLQFLIKFFDNIAGQINFEEIKNLIDFEQNVFKKITLVKNPQELVSILDIFKNPKKFFVDGKIKNILEKDKEIADKLKNKNISFFKFKEFEVFGSDKINKTYETITLFRTEIAKKRYEALNKEIAKFQSAYDIYNEFLKYVLKTIVDILQNKNITTFPLISKVNEMSGYHELKEKIFKINNFLENLKRLVSNIFENKKKLSNIENEYNKNIKILNESIEKMRDLPKEIEETEKELKEKQKGSDVYKGINIKPVDYSLIIKTIETEIKRIDYIASIINKSKFEEFKNIIRELIDKLRNRDYSDYYIKLQKAIEILDELKIDVNNKQVLYQNFSKYNIDLITKELNELKKILFISRSSKLEFKYIPGYGFKTSFIEARQGEKVVLKRLSEIMPPEVMADILDNNPNVITPDELITQLNKVFKNIEEFSEYFNSNLVGSKGDPE